MKINFFYLAISLVLLHFSCSSEDDTVPTDIPSEASIYFPPLNAAETWETKSLAELQWNPSQLAPLQDFLAERNSKSFIILHNGKIVVEHYMNGHTAVTPWYWASAGKTLTSTLTGIAQDEGLLDINTKVSDYLGTGWTSSATEKEHLITSKNLLNMTSGLNDELGDGVSAENLQYVADAGTRWAYHNAYVKLQDVVAQASGQSWDAYFNTKLRDRIGMNGTWFTFGNSNVYASTTRSMARFGLLVSAKGRWEETEIVSGDFLNAATNSSQNINQAYGYLWWLNGKSTYHLPQTQLEFQGELIPNAPEDMYCALGKNDQKLYIVPSQKLVIVRMGDAGDTENFGLSDFDDQLWLRINALVN
ncbi:serine hydrolase [Subsaximicrobium wynnwilliamsii]|uniref:Serine hydrolase n=1 Tax=Subsaximicrobium wynnwilliamsii TaxID=291179 RepID=A0A5C6ZNE6_9FLAO|nr:serine hydrolase [Subsaximicrobium wynnwilliamsii]TXD84852.1 serine hydrolase [Subsaximicrobium wynnwilliamsii]TXD90523.1 serine hydrolase [Subsaximicrobium wynnwilliamsii]TXE04998.1 serine hydrolase [Subsaximicrobium wynnwilliamsii]